MCIFGSTKNARKVHHHLSRDNGIVAYKVLRLRTWGMLESPFQGTSWNSDTMTADEIYSHDSGIYAMKTISGVRANMGNGFSRAEVVFKVLLFGDVYEYGPTQSYGYRHAGYRAQHCQLLEMLPPQERKMPASRYGGGWTRAARPYYGLLRTDLRQIMPELRKRYKDVKLPTYKTLGLS